MNDDRNDHGGRSVALGAGLGMICGAALGNAGFGLVLGAAAGLAVGRLRRRSGSRVDGRRR